MMRIVRIGMVQQDNCGQRVRIGESIDQAEEVLGQRVTQHIDIDREFIPGRTGHCRQFT